MPVITKGTMPKAPRCLHGKAHTSLSTASNEWVVLHGFQGAARGWRGRQRQSSLVMTTRPPRVGTDIRIVVGPTGLALRLKSGSGT